MNITACPDCTETTYCAQCKDHIEYNRRIDQIAGIVQNKEITETEKVKQLLKMDRIEEN